MPNSTMISLRMPNDLLRVLDSLAKKEDLSRTKVIVSQLWNGLGKKRKEKFEL